MNEPDRLTQGAAEAAAYWVLTLPNCSRIEERAFTQWLVESELHVREFLLAVMCDQSLRGLDPERKLSADLRPGLDANNVFPVVRGPQPASVRLADSHTR